MFFHNNFTPLARVLCTEHIPECTWLTIHEYFTFPYEMLFWSPVNLRTEYAQIYTILDVIKYRKNCSQCLSLNTLAIAKQ